jgi:flagellar biosynthesis protein
LSETKPSAPAPRLAAAAIAQRQDAPARPVLVAKGRGEVAEQILALAYAHGVKVREDRDLLQMLEAVELDCEIPLPALAAVAEILTRVYQANGDSPVPPPLSQEPAA